MVKVWIISKKQLFGYIVLVIVLCAFFIWLLIPTNDGKSVINAPKHQSLAVKQLNYTPSEAKAHDKHSWNLLVRRAPNILKQDEYLTTKVHFNHQQNLIEVRLKPKYVKVLNHKSDKSVNTKINNHLKIDAHRIKIKTDARQVAINVMNYHGLMSDDD